MRQLDAYVERFILPTNLQNDPYLYRKAKVLAYINLFLTLLAGFFSIASVTIMPDNKDVPTLVGVLLGLFLLFIFKKKGSLALSGNLLAGSFALVVAPTVSVTGGLFSDNLLWLIVTPLIALLFANKSSGLAWLMALVLFTVYLFQIDGNTANAIFFNSKFYYFLSYSLLFIAIFCTVMIFENGQWLIIKMLHAQNDVLEKQKHEIAQQNKELEAIEEKLKETNLELENFAFAASHDLKEPLRMIGMYTQLTKKRLRGNTDPSAMEFMGYVTDGVSRMQILLDDLLLYSRLGKKEEDIKDVDLNNVLFVVIHNLMATMKDTEASIVANQLPIIRGSSTEMIQLFQNLIANSIKFRKKDASPEIKILLEDTQTAYQLCFEDNGIGIKKEYHEKVFNIFERLHTRNDYEGSGIGLATVKKIVHNAGGRIWLSSTEGVGTAFYFTIPKIHLQSKN
jgi:signal transduction histidine kinase